MRRANLHLDLSSNGGRGGGRGCVARGQGPSAIYQQSMAACARQHSFDDTESAHYHPASYNSSYRYENLYEQIHEEPIYRNVSVSGGGSAGGSKKYGRLDVIGHGIGRIERHLSSSCGNIDHYNMAGHYAVQGHSHVGAVRGAVGNTADRLGSSDGGASSTTTAASSTRDPNVKSSYSSFFNCLSKENSHSMIDMEKMRGVGGSVTAPEAKGSAAEGQEQVEEGAVGGGGGGVEKPPPGRQTGAIPKVNSNNTGSESSGAPRNVNKHPEPSATADPSIYNNSSSMSLNKITKSSMQWLMMNKWLPLWMGQGSDCRVIDFNFMVSRKCEGCGDNCRHTTTTATAHALDNDEELLQQFSAEDSDGNLLRSYGAQPAQFWTPHPTHRTLYGVNGWNDGRLSLRREHSVPGGGGGGYHDQRHYDVPRATGRFAREQFLMGRENGGGGQRGGLGGGRNWPVNSDPFRSWELNVENNTFKPANNRVQDVRRITDGTYRRKEMKESSRVGQPSSLASGGGGGNGQQQQMGRLKLNAHGSGTEEDGVVGLEERRGRGGKQCSESSEEDSCSGGGYSSCSSGGAISLATNGNGVNGGGGEDVAEAERTEESAVISEKNEGQITAAEEEEKPQQEEEVVVQGERNDLEVLDGDGGGDETKENAVGTE